MTDVGVDGPICPRSDLPKAWCNHCRAPVPAGQLPLHHGRPFTAQYHGTCAVCDGHIAPGSQTARLIGAGYACEECIEP